MSDMTNSSPVFVLHVVFDQSLSSFCLCFVWFPDKLIVIRENLTWSEALRYCRQNHVDLVSVHSEEIQHRVMNVVKLASTAEVWLGLRYSHILGVWFWVSGESVCYQNWAPGNGTSEEDCEHTDTRVTPLLYSVTITILGHQDPQRPEDERPLLV
uniref:C-type lectin domain-containing protein n=1 Tax=Cyprinus carpio TaxID=7962 RepID=A0A8C1REW5_CYPCA